MWATFVFNKTELEAPVTVAKKKAKKKIRVKRQNKKDDELMILDEELLKPKGNKKRTVDAGELEKGKKKKRTDDDEVPEGKKKKRTDDEEVPQGKEAEEATSANDDKRHNVQLQAAKKEFRAFVQSNDVKPENYVSTLKKFFDHHMMSSLWSELKRQRQRSKKISKRGLSYARAQLQRRRRTPSCGV